MRIGPRNGGPTRVPDTFSAGRDGQAQAIESLPSEPAWKEWGRIATVPEAALPDRREKLPSFTLQRRRRARGAKKQEIAFAQTYFAVQTRKQEIIEKRLAEAERISARKKLTKSEKELSGIIFDRLRENESFGRIRSKADVQTAVVGGSSEAKRGAADGGTFGKTPVRPVVCQSRKKNRPGGGDRTCR